MSVTSADILAALDADQEEVETRPGYVVPTVDTDRPYTAAWTDGSSTGKVGPGGWAWCVVDGPQAGLEASGGATDTTNQRMELLAAHEAVRAIPGLLLIVSDSEYVVRCFTERWYLKWMDRRFHKVKNADLWWPFVVDVLERAGEVRFTWVKGHAGLEGNERADALAKAAKVAAKEQL